MNWQYQNPIHFLYTPKEYIWLPSIDVFSKTAELLLLLFNNLMLSLNMNYYTEVIITQ